jgi:hypothetical protein
VAEVEVEYQDLHLVHHLILLELEDSVVEAKVIKLMEFQAIPEMAQIIKAQVVAVAETLGLMEELVMVALV